MKIKCKNCGEVIEGDKKGTYITCKCKKIAIDETEDYWRIIGNPEDFEIIEVDEMKKNLKKIINHYGVEHQLRKLHEEVYETTEAILEKENFDIYAPDDIDFINVNKIRYATDEYYEKLKEHIAEEVADCLVLLGQFKEYYGIPDEYIKEVMEYKIQRQLERIDEE